MIEATMPERRLRVRNATLASLGNVVEWLDFTIYGFFALTISKVFFPIADPKLALLASFVTFGIGSGARPVAAIIFGRLGDLKGRRFVLLCSISMMAAGSLMIAFAPSYASAGFGGTVILVLGRLLQGLSAGAEFGSAIAYLIEWAPKGQRGLYGSFHQVAAGCGVLGGALISALLNSVLDPADMLAWGWRIPFAIGGALALVALLLRLRMVETPEWEQTAQTRTTVPAVRPAILRPALQVMGILALWSVSVFAAVIYMPTYMVQHGHLTPGRALWATVIGLIAMLVTIPFAGHATDRFGTKPVILAAVLGYLLAAYPGFVVLSSGPDYSVVVAIITLFAILSGVISGVGPVAIAERFATAVRSTWTSIASALSTTLFGGFAPAVITLLIQRTGSDLAPAYYIMAVALLTGATALTLSGRRELPPRAGTYAMAPVTIEK